MDETRDIESVDCWIILLQYSLNLILEEWADFFIRINVEYPLMACLRESKTFLLNIARPRALNDTG